MVLVTNSSFISIIYYPSYNHLSKLHPPFFTPKLVPNSTSYTPTTALITNLDKRCGCYDLHDKLVPYEKAWDWQKRVVSEKKKLIEKNEACPDSLMVLQHLPVYTMGSGSSEEYLNFDKNNAPFDVFRTERGGEVTYHGPGQLVMYPIINLRNHKMDLHWYLRSLEEVVIRALSTTFSIKASRVKGLTGVWVGDQKLAAVGIRVSHWISYHGLALNVNADLTPFQWIVPCGIRNRRVGSIRGIMGEALEKYGAKAHDGQLIDTTYKSLVNEFAEVFQLDVYQIPVSLSDIFDKDETVATY